MWIAVVVFINLTDPTNILFVQTTETLPTKSECELVIELKMAEPPFDAITAGRCIDISEYLKGA